MRDGVPIDVPAEDLVTDDLVLLEGGDRVSADLRLDVVHALAVDTSTLTGESVPAHPSVGDTVHAGCFVVEGEARATVVATAARTRLAGIAGLTRAQRPAPTPLRLELDRVSRLIAAVAIAVGVVFFGLSLLVGTKASDGFLFAVGVTVAVVPCGLLPTVTLSLAIGAQRMAGRHALVRHLEAVETLGSTTFICTDKTGTLTLNEMAVVEVWMPAGRAVIEGSGYEPVADVAANPPRAADPARNRPGRRPELVGPCCRGRWPAGSHVVTRWKRHCTPSPDGLRSTPRATHALAPETRRFPFDSAPSSDVGARG